MCLKDFKKTFLLFSLLLLTAPLLYAQQSTVSPYSRYGVGELESGSFVHQKAMGGIGTAFNGQDRLNFLNPASYAFDTITTFEPGVRGEYSNLSTSTESQNASGVYFSHLAIGFPVVKNKMGACLGVMPYSSMGYNVRSTTKDEHIGIINSTYKGEGGVSRFFIGAGYAPFSSLQHRFIASEKYKKLLAEKNISKIVRITNRNNALSGFSIGFNFSWLFGPLNTTRSVEFASAPNSYNTRIINIVSLGDAYFDLGAMYNLKLKKEKFINFGLTGAKSTNIRTKYNSVWYNYTSSGGVFETAFDTVQIIHEQIGYTTIPMYYSAGISTGKTGKWLIEADYTTQQWSKFSSFDVAGSLTDSYKISLGGEFIPNKKSFNYAEKIQYRFGGHYAKSYVNLNNTDILDYGISFGGGLPVINKDRIQKATVQIGFEIGRNGTTKNDLLRQEYMRFHIGVTVNESWFFKRKYD